MKKQLLLLAAVATIFASCGESTETATTKTEEAPANTEAPVANTTEVSSDIPNFSTPELKALAQEYTTYMHEASAAAKAGDAAKIQELTAKASEWATKTTAAVSKMTQEDQKIWTDYFTKLAQDMAK